MHSLSIDALRKERDMHARNAVELMRQRDELLEALRLATRSVRILGDMLQGERRKETIEISAAVERIARYEDVIAKALGGAK